MIEQISFWVDVLFYLSVIGAFVIMPLWLIYKVFNEKEVDITNATDEELEEIFKEIDNE